MDAQTGFDLAHLLWKSQVRHVFDTKILGSQDQSLAKWWKHSQVRRISHVSTIPSVT